MSGMTPGEIEMLNNKSWAGHPVRMKIPGVRNVTVWMVSRIGQPINRPLVVSTQLSLKKGFSLKRITGDVEDLIKNELVDMENFCNALAKGQFGIC
jgi:S-adenosylmethionine synthetase